MITSIHALIYSDDAPKTRAFLRDVLGWQFVEHADSEPGWLIFKSGPSEIGVHPTSGVYEGKTYTSPRHHSISLMCDDIHKTMQELQSKGATFQGGVNDYGFGLCAMMDVPAADPIMLYQPLHPTAFDL